MNIRARLLGLPLLVALVIAFVAAGHRAPSAAAPSAGPPLRALLVGGGPSRDYNQVGIESNVRYLRRLLPSGAQVRTLFADGRSDTSTVQYLDDQGKERYRATSLKAVDGPSRRASLDREFARLHDTASNSPLLLYFTGHGSPDRAGEYADNGYGLWHEGDLTVHQLSTYLDTLPASTPVTLVMVQCFSGGFGNLLFQGSDPQGAWAGRRLCGFFASLPSREAAGCTPEVNEADYHDFTSYFFAALSGRDRLDHPVSGADYDGNGRVGMDEAFAYTLLHDASIDTPISTSDVFLRRYVTTPDSDVFATPYSQVHAWATPAQRAALDGLSAQLKIQGEGRLAGAYNTVQRRTGRRRGSDTESEEELTARWIRLVRVGKSVVLAHTLQSSGTSDDKAHFAALVTAESANPVRPG